jgi:hypothetical protein
LSSSTRSKDGRRSDPAAVLFAIRGMTVDLLR